MQQFQQAKIWLARKCEEIDEAGANLISPSPLSPSLPPSLPPQSEHSTWKTSNASIMPLSEFKPNRERARERERERERAKRMLRQAAAACMPMSCREYQAGKGGCCALLLACQSQGRARNRRGLVNRSGMTLVVSMRSPNPSEFASPARAPRTPCTNQPTNFFFLQHSMNANAPRAAYKGRIC